MAVEVHMHHLRLLSLVNYLLSSMTEHDPGGHPNSQKDGRKQKKKLFVFQRYLIIIIIIHTLTLKKHTIKQKTLVDANHGGLHPCGK